MKPSSGFNKYSITSPLSTKKTKVAPSSSLKSPMMKTIEIDDLPELILTKPPPPITLKRPQEKKKKGMF